jgi:hypothetical protein
VRDPAARPALMRRRRWALAAALLGISAVATFLWLDLTGVPSPVPGALRAGLLTGGQGAAMLGTYHGWVAPADARVLLEGSPCPANDPPAHVTLHASAGLERLVGTGGESITFAGGVAPASLPASPGTLPVLDLGAAFAGADQRAYDVTFTGVHVACRSWREAAWRLEGLAVRRVGAPASADLPLFADLMPEPVHTGVYALLFLSTQEAPVTVRSISYAPDGAASGQVVVGVGTADHWQSWRDALRRWSEAGGSGPIEVGPGGPRPYWRASDPTPPLQVRRADDLSIELEPYSTAFVAVGSWSFRRPPELLVSFPTVTYVHDGVTSSIGLTEPVLVAAR